MGGELLGRDDELRRLADALETARVGRGTAVVVTGLPGIGKSALVSAALGRLDPGVPVLAGRGLPALRSVAYAAIVPALRSHLDGLPQPARARLYSELPVLDEVFADDAVPRPDDAPDRDAPTRNVLLMEAITVLLQRIAAPTQAVMWIDDAQDVDPESSELVAYLVQRCADHPVTVVLARTPLGDGAGSLDWSVVTEAELPLRPLPTEATQALVDRALPDATADVRRRIVELAGGVPGYAIALVTDLAGDQLQFGDHEEVPIGPRVHALATRRFAGLSEGARQVLDVLATASRPVGATLLPALLADLSSVDQPVQWLWRAGFVSRTPGPTGSTYAIAHPLDRRAVAASMGEERRRALHVRHLEVLRSIPRSDPRDLAWHHREAPGALTADEVVPLLLAGARRASDEGDSADAVRTLEAAAALVDPGTPDAFATVSQRLADALYRAGHPGRARDTLVAAIDALPSGDPRLSPLQDLLALIHSDLHEDERSRRALRAVVRDAPVSVGLSSAEQVVHRMFLVTRSANPQDAVAMAAELAQFEDSDDPDERAIGLVGAAMTAFAARDVVAARLHAEQALAGTRVDVVWGAASREFVRACFVLGDLPAMRACLDEQQAHTHRVGPLAVEASQLSSTGLLELLVGNGPGARDGTDAGLRLARRSAAARSINRCLLGSAIVSAELGAADRARAELAEAQRTGGAPTQGEVRLSHMADCVRAALYLAHQSTSAPPVAGGQREEFDWYVLAMHPLLTGRLALATDRPGDARAEEEFLRTFGPQSIVTAALADRLAGLCALHAGAAGQALAPLGAAATALARVGLHLLAAQTRVERGEALTVAQEPVPRDEPAALVAFFDTQGVRPWADRARRLARALGVRVPGPRTGAGALTARETEVARLAAAGRSNAQIAAALFLSERTVETHLRHVYTRLGIDGRIELARYMDRGPG